MYAIRIPRNAKEAIQFDKENGNTFWQDAMKKEISMINKFNVFELKRIGFEFASDWQYAPLHWVFAVKHDLRHKARLVIGGHVTDASGYDRYAATIRTETIRL